MLLPKFIFFAPVTLVPKQNETTCEILWNA